jgi:membrane dipeptidase
MTSLPRSPFSRFVACTLAHFVSATAANANDPEPATLARARELASRLLVVDTHIDLPYRLIEQIDAGQTPDEVSRRTANGDFDGPRAREGGLDAAWMSIYVPASYQKRGGAKEHADRLIDLVEEIARKSPALFALARTPAEVEAAARAGKVALPLGIENGAAIENEIRNLKHFFERGVRYITLTHSEDNLICDSSFAPAEKRTWRGLSPFGREVIAEMNRLGILVDLSHVSDEAFDHAIEIVRAPPIASHSSCRKFTPGWERNLDDARIQKLAAKGGVIQVNFGSSFLTAAASRWLTEARKAEREFRANSGGEAASAEIDAFREQYRKEHPLPRATLDDVVAHIEHVILIAGIDHVGLGSDFDGVGPTLPCGLEDVSKYPNLLAKLLEKGRSEEEIAKIAGGNLMRVWREAERVAREMQGRERN